MLPTVALAPGSIRSARGRARRITVAPFPFRRLGDEGRDALLPRLGRWSRRATSTRATAGAEAYYTKRARVAVEIDTWRAGERQSTTRLAAAGELARWVEGIDPITGEVKGTIRVGGKDRQPLRFVEVVVNNPKSLSIVATQNPSIAAAYDAVLHRQADGIARYCRVSR